MVYGTVRFAAPKDAPEEAQIMRISIAELQLAGFLKRTVCVVNFEVVQFGLGPTITQDRAILLFWGPKQIIMMK